MQKNQKGFSTVEALLIAIIVVIIGGAGLLVYQSQKKTNQSLDNANKTLTDLNGKKAQNNTTPQLSEEVSGWKEVTSSKKAFSMRIPDGWKVTNDTAVDRIMSSTSEALVYQKGIPATVLTQEIGGSDNIYSFQIFIAKESYQGWTDENKATKSDFGPVDGMNGTKYSQTYKKDEPLGIGSAEGGEKAYEYEFQKNGKYYHIAYFVRPGETDNFEILEKAIKTLKVN